MPLDPQAQALIASAAGGTPTELMTLEEGRASLEERARLTAGPPPPVAQILERDADGVPLRVYLPDAERPLPVLVYFHGGGWVRGSLNTHDVPCRALANGAQCAVVSVDYRRAPETKFPGAVDDCLNATRWVVEHAAELGLDPHRVAVGGDSAGGNLAAVVAQLARDHGGPQLVFQLLIYPVTDYDLNTPSYLANAQGYLLTREAMRYYWDQYLRSEADAEDPRATPLRARDLSGLPPALVITAEFDPLRDEGRAYAERLRMEGVRVTYSDYPGMIHGFVMSAGVLDRGQDALREAAAALRDAFAAVPAGTV